ncbi:MAG: AAA family ATPase [Armatimonadia bacterium]|nr:AAA family ATPase [Armatimonadia bacterium]
MKLKIIHIKNFRRLEDLHIDLDDGETVFVGPNNSGKTSATAIFRYFLKGNEFRIHDFSVSRIREINHFGSVNDKEDLTLPSIDLDLWFTIDPDIEFGRVFSLLPNTLSDLDEVGIRISFAVKQDNIDNLVSAYSEAKSLKKEGDARDAFTLSKFLNIQGNLKKYFRLHYFVLEKGATDSIISALEPSEAEHVLSSLIRIDFVDAQRNIDDQEASRSNRLSSAFATFYKHNLEEPEINEAASQVIDENNKNLSDHYEMTFKDLMGVISRLGVPSVNDRSLKIVSTLNPEVALKGNTELLYIDPLLNHELPEAYNGLCFKNLIYIAIQVTHYHLQWINTKVNRPICHLIFIEEPEVHLHAQVQQTFITNIWNVLKENAKEAGEGNLVPQLCVTTHSSHILDAVEFHKVRYFKRCQIKGECPEGVKALHASTVISLQDFQPKDTSAADEEDNREETLKFLKQYLKLTHCDLFFADAAVLVEGVAEKLLLPKMIEMEAKELKICYLTVLEVGGAYAHRFAELFKFIGIPYLIITDCDSIDPDDARKSCRANTPGAKTSNACIKFFYDKDITIEQLNNKEETDQILEDGCCYLTFQKPLSVDGYQADEKMHGRTFEEAFIYENLDLFKDGKVTTSITLEGNHDKDYELIYNLVKSANFKKAEFALDIVFSEEDWRVPHYIKSGLIWLQSKMGTQLDTIQEALT